MIDGFFCCQALEGFCNPCPHPPFTVSQDVARRSRTSLGYEVVGEQLRAVTSLELNGAEPLEPSLSSP